MARLAVGAVSRRVVEEAAKAQVVQIVASRRQVDIGGGYTGLDQEGLVRLVHELSGGQTQVVRDHGGPGQGAQPDDGKRSLIADMNAEFDVLHLDVCKLPGHRRIDGLLELVQLVGDNRVDIGGEHTQWGENKKLLEVAVQSGAKVSHVVVGHVSTAGTYIHADMQFGTRVPPEEVQAMGFEAGVPTKLHNADWMPGRKLYVDLGMVDIVNIAPEAALAEIDALLCVASPDWAKRALAMAYNSKRWDRWFGPTEGTWMQRAKCALRYVIGSSTVPAPVLAPEDESFVRTRIQESLHV